MGALCQRVQQWRQDERAREEDTRGREGQILWSVLLRHLQQLQPQAAYNQDAPGNRTCKTRMSLL